jgi:hypothetical protein
MFLTGAADAVVADAGVAVEASSMTAANADAKKEGTRRRRIIYSLVVD